ncbi:MAG: DMT family transporter [Actinobacteria bacterium]|nr:DMT family transporter [Actinomycetota bacterium]
MTKVGWGRFALVGFLWGTPYLFLKIAVAEIAPAAIVFLRVLIGAIVLMPIAIRQKTFFIARKYWPFVLLYTITELIGPWYLITNAEQKITSGLAGLLVATVPIWAAILASIFGDHTVWHKSRLFGLIIGFIGVVAVVGIESLSGRQDILSISMVLLAAMGYAYAINMINRRIPQVAGLALNTWAMIITSVVYLPFALAGWPSESPSIQAIGSVLALGVFCTAIAFILFFKVVVEVGPPRASLVTYLNTTVAVLLGVVLLGEPLTLGIALGLPLVLIGSYFASRKVSR